MRVGEVMHRTHSLGMASDVPEGGRRVYTVGTREIVVFNVDGELRAIENRCGRGLPLDRATIIDGQLLCPWHGWAFDLEAGRCTLVADHRTPVLPLRLDQGELFVEVDESPT
jgi:nitrite reductase/ring-hydroxylating ferredoxin subunit